MTDVDPARLEALTFDCYGTLIDWESGIVAALRAQLGAELSQLGDEELLERFAAVEHEAQVPYRPYREVLGTCIDAIAAGAGAEVDEPRRAAFAQSVGDWPAFADSADALGRLQTRYRLCVITNCDDDLFELSARRLGVTFDEVVTAQQVQAYKPDERGFHEALRRLRLDRDRVLHVAQSLFHDHVPAKRLGLTTVWIDRRSGAGGPGATPPAEAVPDLTLPDMASLADRLTG